MLHSFTISELLLMDDKTIWLDVTQARTLTGTQF